MIRGRVVSGMARTRITGTNSGRSIGRPTIAEATKDAVHGLLGAGQSAAARGQQGRCGPCAGRAMAPPAGMKAARTPIMAANAVAPAWIEGPVTPRGRWDPGAGCQRRTLLRKRRDFWCLPPSTRRFDAGEWSRGSGTTLGIGSGGSGRSMIRDHVVCGTARVRTTGTKSGRSIDRPAIAESTTGAIRRTPIKGERRL
jgi:hypothetical protein